MSFGRRLARRRLDHAIDPATFVDTALGTWLHNCNAVTLVSLMISRYFPNMR
jgi:hypothetical protein